MHRGDLPSITFGSIYVFTREASIFFVYFLLPARTLRGMISGSRVLGFCFIGRGYCGNGCVERELGGGRKVVGRLCAQPNCAGVGFQSGVPGRYLGFVVEVLHDSEHSRMFGSVRFVLAIIWMLLRCGAVEIEVFQGFLGVLDHSWVN